MTHRFLSVLLLAAACAAPLAAGEILIPLAGGTTDGTTYSARVWVTNTGATPRRWTATFVAPGGDGTRPAPAGTSRSLTVSPGATIQATNLAPGAQPGILLVSGAPQLLTTARLEAAGRDGRLQAAVGIPLVTGRQLAPAQTALHLHGLTHRQGGLITDLQLVNAARQPAQCAVDAFRDDGSRLGSTLRYTLPPRSSRTVERALPLFGAAAIDEARLAVSCDQAFYAQARVYKPGSGELNLVTPSRALSQP